MATSVALWWICLLLAAPPLPDAEREQLATAADASRRIDEGALYPLLRNVVQWQPGASVRAWVDPDYQQLFDEPAAHRGELIQVEGWFYGRSHRFTLRRRGEWGEALTMWVLVLERDPQRFAVVFLVDPEGHWHERAPRAGQRVRVNARFYKLWTIEDEQDAPVLTDYLAFVGREPRIVGGAGTGAGPDVGQMMMLLALAVAALLFVLWRSRTISLRPRPLTRQQMRHETTGQATPAPKQPADDQTPDLPDDPAAALDALSRRHENTEKNENDLR